MRSSARGHVCMMTIFFPLLFGCLALPVIGRSSKLLMAEETVGALAAAKTSGNNKASTVNDSITTSGDGSEIHLIFCTYKFYCFHGNCYCCKQADNCFKSFKECQAHCPSCNPICPQPGPGNI
ncbi:hypothetical protein BDA96_04G033200 [Sorghum bicolor]|uniref:Embryo surrounding factor 1 brassicaceae domain-containing protein n=1 Tax=Sorghum bicolor TaxID=4558 RepID=A0A921R2M2_SORBI|nr:hypothetical protein BDA96_04G033200 [Sorghum bicolor]